MPNERPDAPLSERDAELQAIAHEFNNLLTAIGSCVDLLSDQLAEEHAAMALIDVMDRSTIRATELTKRLLALSQG